MCIGPLRSLTLGRTEAREAAEQIAREIGVDELTMIWNRTFFERAEEHPQWGCEWLDIGP
jgi:hypothetical protein